MRPSQARARSRSCSIRPDGDTLYFQNSVKYKIHFQFASTHLSGNGQADRARRSPSFNQTEYYSPDRRFILGAITYYEGPEGLGARDRALRHGVAGDDREALPRRSSGRPTSARRSCSTRPRRDRVQARNALPADVRGITTDELYAGIDYQPLNLGDGDRPAALRQGVRPRHAIRRLTATSSSSIACRTTSRSSPASSPRRSRRRSHTSTCSSQNRKTPNMGLRKATTNGSCASWRASGSSSWSAAFDWSVKRPRRRRPTPSGKAQAGAGQLPRLNLE